MVHPSFHPANLLYTLGKGRISFHAKKKKEEKKEKQKGKPRYPDSHVVPTMVLTERSSA